MYETFFLFSIVEAAFGNKALAAVRSQLLLILKSVPSMPNSQRNK